jgi:hypothetical protein
MTEIEEDLEQIEYNMEENKGELLDKQKLHVDNEFIDVTEYKNTEEILNGKELEFDQSKHDFDMNMIDAQDAFEEEMKDKRVALWQGAKKTLYEDVNERRLQDAKDRADQLEVEWRAAEAYKDAAIDAANMLAGANLMTELTHSLGQGSELTPTNVTWTNRSSI